MKRKKSIKKDTLVPNELMKVISTREITSDYVLEIYEKAKKAKSKSRKEQLLSTAEKLSKHIGKWLVE